MTAISLAPTFSATAMSDLELDWLTHAVRQNRFLPAPDPTSIFVGDGDFRTIGAEFLGHLVRIGGVLPPHRVLDIGSGIGRLAVPLTQYLGPHASYLGIDPTREGIIWSQQHITRLYPNFRFRHLDVAHEIYNPDGLLRGDSLVLPVGNASIDFAFMVSVVTHLPPAEVMVYMREVARVLAPGGRFMITSFILDDAGQRATHPYQFTRTVAGPDWHVDPDTPYGAVGFDAGWLQTCLLEAGLRIERTSLGHWRGVKASHFQDIIVATKPHRGV